MRRAIRFTLFVLIFGGLLGTDYARQAPISWEWLREWRDVVVDACNSRGVQQVELVCLCAYLLAFALRLRQLGRSTRRPGVAAWAWNAENVRTACLVGFCGAALAVFFFGPPSLRGAMDPIVLFWGLVVGKGGRLLKMSQQDHRKASQVQGDILKALLAVITVSVLVQPSWWQGFQYHGQHRWQGPWWNPNTFGMLMGLGLVLAVGETVLSLKSKVCGFGNGRHLTANPHPQPISHPMGVGGVGLSPDEAERGKPEVQSLKSKGGDGWRRVKTVLFVAAAGLCSLGLVKSYSRAGWVGAGGGLAFLLWNWIRATAKLTGNPQPQPLSHPMGEGSVELASLLGHTSPGLRQLLPIGCGEEHCDGEGGDLPRSSWFSWFQKNWHPASLILASVLVLALWCFRDTDFLVARRVFSVGNVNDLSWRYRLDAYEGGLQMMATRPWSGFGWDQPKTVYEEFYMPTKLTDGRAIELNDYFVIGLTLGVPAFVCFLGYLFLSLFPPWPGGADSRMDGTVNEEVDVPPERWLDAICGAGLIVLLVGFWLQRGLFCLSLTVPFWVLLEFGRRKGIGSPNR